MYDNTELHTFECEVCETVATLTDQAAFQAGWDYPPFMGTWGVVSPRTCPNCGMMSTAWWTIIQGRELTEKQAAFCQKVMEEV